ncbi:MAG: calcium/sodium antiporter [Clostridia bacterium]|nr:calcium/sodium antiporter [Clostridia bacterium]
MTKAVILFILGLVLLIKGGDWFVDGATGIARRFKIPEILIGATVASIGTTLPEVMVSDGAALARNEDKAYGNAIGSIICNTALISAITLVFAPSEVDRKTFKTPVIFFFISAVFYALVAYLFKDFSRFIGICLLAVFVVYMIFTVLQAKKEITLNKPEEDTTYEGNTLKDIVLLIIGAALIAVGAKFLVDNGTYIAEELGVPQTVISLTFVALGTSLPELVTAITALVKGHGALSLGNIVGANLFNLVLVSGLSVTLSPFSLPSEKQILGQNASLVVDVPVMFAVMLIMTLPALIKGKLYRTQGILLLLIYAAFCVFQFAL